VNPTLLGTVTRTDIVANTAVQQVTYAGAPVYQFFLNKAPGETHGANLFDPATTPAGVWYLLSPGRGLPDPGMASLSPETLTVTISGTSTSASVLTALEDQGLVPGGLRFPVYTFSADSGHSSACLGACAVVWPPVLTTKRAQAINGADPNLVGIIVRPDGSHQVTYAGHPLYLFRNDAVFPGAPVVAKGQGLGGGFGGTFSLIPPQ
jgi:predicted lipoprotein with Yx(FWY)xxD motif